MRIQLLALGLIFSYSNAQALECAQKQNDYLDLSSQFGPHLDQNETGRCYAFASAKMIEASLYRSQNYKKYSIDPDILAAEYYAFAKSQDMLESLKTNLKTKNGDLFSGGDQQDILRMLATKRFPLFSRSDDSAVFSQTRLCESTTRKYYEKKTDYKKSHAFLQNCISHLNKNLQGNTNAIKNIPDLSLVDIYDVSKTRGCRDSVLKEMIDAVLCQSIPMITSLEVPFDPGDANNPYPINLFEVTATELEILKSKTHQNLDEKKYSRLNTNMMKHAIIVSGKITLGQSKYYILKNSFSAEFALLPDTEVCSLSRAQAFVTKNEAKDLERTLKQIITTAQLKKQSQRKPTSSK